MYKHIAFRLAAATCIAIVAARWSLAITQPGSDASEAIKRWWSYIVYLADDKLEGRNTGSPGYRKAADYVAKQFHDDGLKPAGTDGFLQPVPFVVTEVDQNHSKAELVSGSQSTPLKIGREVIFPARAHLSHEEVSAPLVFIGYGISAPEAGYDDLSGGDLKGKIVIYIAGAGPKSVPGNIRAHASSFEERGHALEAAGALGSIAIYNPQTVDIPWDRLRNTESRAGLDIDEPALDPSAWERFAAIMNPASAPKLFAGANHSWEEVLKQAQAGKPLPRFPLPCSIRANVVSHLSKVNSPNVAGILEGSDPQLKREYVVLSAHLDHLGVGDPVNGDSIYNGAMDNAAGVASIMEIAKDLKEQGKRPKRSILFVAVTGEEKGLLGAQYFVAHPTIPRHDIVADINTDMFLPIHPLHVLTVYGLNESTVGDTVLSVAAAHNVPVQDDPIPERNIFIRSDQYRFVAAGIPAVLCDVGAKPGTQDEGVEKRWLSTRYHAPSDDVSQPVDFQAAALFNQMMLEIAMDLANDSMRPHWKEKSFFKRFATD